MAKRKDRYRRRLQEAGIVKSENPNVMVHGAMWYKCNKCGRKWRMWLEKGLEDREQDKIYPKAHKPVPFTIGCTCGGLANHVEWQDDISLGGYRPIADHMSYFKNDPNSDCGVPIVRGER